MTDQPRLATELGQWIVSLQSGHRISLMAHAYDKVADEYVFTVLMYGQPCFEVEIARLTSDLVVAILGG
jgi:hypothetical protein